MRSATWINISMALADLAGRAKNRPGMELISGEIRDVVRLILRLDISTASSPRPLPDNYSDLQF